MRRHGLDEQGDAVMATAVMLFALMLSLGSSFLLNYGEVSGKENEMHHLTEIDSSFMRIRNSMLKLTRSEDTSTSIMNRMTLGTPGNPYIGMARSSGEFSMDPDPNHFKMEVVLEDGATDPVLNSVSGSMYYRGNNYYFNDQDYYFEAGGIFINEYDFITRSVMPSVLIQQTQTGWIMEMEAYDLSSSAWTVTGIETLALRINMAGSFSNVITPFPGQIISLRVNSPNEQAWAAGFREVLRIQGLVEGVDFSLDEPVDWTDPGDHLEVDLLTPENFQFNVGQMEVSLI